MEAYDLPLSSRTRKTSDDARVRSSSRKTAGDARVRSPILTSDDARVRSSSPTSDDARVRSSSLTPADGARERSSAHLTTDGALERPSAKLTADGALECCTTSPAATDTYPFFLADASRQLGRCDWADEMEKEEEQRLALTSQATLSKREAGLPLTAAHDQASIPVGANGGEPEPTDATDTLSLRMGLNYVWT